MPIAPQHPRMKRALTVTTVLLLATLTSCGGGVDHTQSKASHASSQTKAGRPSAMPTPSTAKSCGPMRDVIVWYQVPGTSDSAQLVGSYNISTCETIFEDLPRTSPTQAGYCTLGAWASDNPGYDPDARPAGRPRKIQAAVGPAC